MKVLENGEGERTPEMAGDTRLPRTNLGTMPTIADSVPTHYVGYTAVGEVQMASVSILQKPLLHLYSDFLRSGGCTARKVRELHFTDNGIRVCQSKDSDQSEQFFHYALITYTNTVVLRTFKSHGKKLYGMFEPTSPVSYTTGDRPGTLFPLEKRFSKIDNIPIFPLVAMLYRPDPPNNHLHCHAFACINIDQSNQVFDNIQARVKSFFEDYETLSVDDNMFSTHVPDFWKLTDDGWRMTMPKKKRKPQQEDEESEPENEDDEIGEVKVNEMRRQSRDLAVFAQAKVLSRRQTGTNDLFPEYRVPTSDSGVESPTADVPEAKSAEPGSPRRDRPKYIRGGVRVLPAPPQSPFSALSPEIPRRGPPVAPKPKNYRLLKPTPQPEPGPPAELVMNGHTSDPADDDDDDWQDIWYPLIYEPAVKPASKEDPVKSPPPVRKDEKSKDYIFNPELDVETRPMEEWDWEEVGLGPATTQPEVSNFTRSKAIRRPSESKPKPPEPAPPSTAPFRRGKGIRKMSDVNKEQHRNFAPSFEGPVLMIKSDQFLHDEDGNAPKQTPTSPKDNEIELLLSDMHYTRGIDGVERTASMMNFERSLGYLP